MKKLDLDLNDLTPTALKRLVKQLLVSDNEEEEKKLLASMGKSHKVEEKNELADLKEEKRGKAPKVNVEEDAEIKS